MFVHFDTPLTLVQLMERFEFDQSKEICGGNHAQFGMYGEQKGDQVSDIDVLEQQNQIIQTTLEFLSF